ncbi:pyrimidine operon attenuation protein / uracil phosphoribosyltransferase [Sulfurivirga caldicuralii]|uniref:Pyrimidine operon attenuation protein / uracil phosphoribosyltransferase n=1 Tax=Sulfurivirga caldicuralii TaxID=364032 RepID=A0A1N6DQW6_9GAMM|nr:bifunctional pyr operon transcriptional regulator/uracil phosphoribosyltransferase PyrR [Sulfurivirga caldicuralii]SIN73205.1 pyrimidine operon attenuation protein / uracil phosphoribosyltransferase [Sulfurivirga caldicuralii]
MKLNLDVNSLLDTLEANLREDPIMGKNPHMIGIRSGGLWIAQQLHQRLGLETPLGELDIAFYRDDFSRVGLHPTVRPSHIPWNVEDAHIILVDDVLYTGRTIRAALNEIFDYGRPAQVLLTTLLERPGCRELPICAQYVGAQLNCDQKVKLLGPDPLELHLIEDKEEVA